MTREKANLFTFPHLAYLLVRAGLGVVFLWASWDKIAHPREFAAIIDNYQIIPEAAVNLAALALPWIECLCGLLLLTGRTLPGATLTVNLLLAIFIVVTGFNLYRGLDVTCGCFSVSPDAGRETAWNLVRNTLLLGVGIWLFIYTAGKAERENPEPAGGGKHHAG